jgi:hypothetical protein
MTPQAQINRAFELLKKAQAQLDNQTRGTRGPNVGRVAEFLKSETVAGDSVSALTVSDTNGIGVHSTKSCAFSGIRRNREPGTTT